MVIFVIAFSVLNDQFDASASMTRLSTKSGTTVTTKALMNLPGVASAKKLTHMDKISKVPGNFTGGNIK
jgi:hypothetical protein